MRKIEIFGRLAAFAATLAFAGTGLTACGGSSKPAPSGSGAAQSSSASAHTGTSSTTATPSATRPSSPSSTTPASKAQSAKTREQIAERLRSLRSRATSTHAQVAPAVQQSAFRTALTRFASCLRQHGVKIPAPSSKGPALSTRGLNTNSPQYRAAVAKCRSVLIAAFRQAAHARR